jgi:hypothetical protein
MPLCYNFSAIIVINSSSNNNNNNIILGLSHQDLFPQIPR